MPFLLADDAADEAARRLQEYGTGLLQPLQPIGSAAGSAFQSAGATVGDITQRLQDFGSQQLTALNQQAPQILQNQPQGGLQDITQRLQDHGTQVLDQAANAANQVTQLIPLNKPVPPPQMTQLTEEQPQTQPLQQAGGPGPSGGIDSSSPQAFAKSVAPYAQYAAQQLGIDPTWVAAMMGSESNYGKAPGNELFGVKALPGQPGTTRSAYPAAGQQSTPDRSRCPRVGRATAGILPRPAREASEMW